MNEQASKNVQEHRDFLLKIANEVNEIVRDPTIMARFRSQVRLFCIKNHDHAVEVRQLRKAYEADTELQAAIKELEREKWGKTWDEMTEDERHKVHPDEFPIRPPPPYWDFVFYWDEFGFWGPPTKTPNLWYYLSTPVQRAYMDVEGELDAWKLEAMKSSNDEKIISCYALLAAIHDQEIPEKPIFTKKVYDGGWPLGGEWISSNNLIHKLSLKWRELAYPWEQDSYEGSKDNRSWIARAFDDIKADLAGIGQAETGRNTHRFVRDSFPDIPKEDRRLFLKIGVDIKKHSDEYCDAGKWLDDYYDKAHYWARRQSELERLRRLEAEGNALTPGQEKDKEGLEHLIKKKHPLRLDYRLQEAWLALYSKYRSLISQEGAKAVLLIAWLATDVDADKADLSLTQFEKWPWESFWEPITDDDFKQLGRTLLMSLLWYPEEYPEYPRDHYYENECLQLVRAAWARREAEKHLTNKPAETGKKDEPDDPLSWMSDSLAEIPQSAEQWIGPFDPTLRFDEDTEGLTDILTLKDCITHLKKILPYWIECQFIFPKSDILANMIHTIRCWLAKVRHDSDQKLPPIPPDLIGMVDWIPSVEKILVGGTMRQEPAVTGRKVKLAGAEPKIQKWTELRIDFIDDETIRYSLEAGRWKRAHCSELGFLDKRKGLPNQLWDQFRTLAQNCKDGYIEIRTTKNIQKNLDRICQTLKDFFGPHDRPIIYLKKDKRWQVKFDLSWKRDCGN